MWYAKMYFSGEKEFFENDAFGMQGLPSKQLELPFLESLLTFLELDEKEIDSWIRLTRVLTHEIMNSVTPITSLSETLLSLADTRDEEIRRGLQTISTTGKGLLSFVESYRRFTRIPTPEPSLFYVKAFIFFYWKK